MRTRLLLRSPRGFTLIELLLVMLILALLLAIAVPAFLGHQAKAQDAEAKQYLSISYRAARADAASRESFGPSLVSSLAASEPGLTFATGTCAQAQTGAVNRVVLAPMQANSLFFTAYIRSRSGNLFELEASTTDGDSRQISACPGRVYFLSDQAATITNVWRMDGDGSNQLQITNPPGSCGSYSLQCVYGDFDISPDGTKMVYVTSLATGAELAVWNLRTGATAALTSDGTDYSSPAWSPDGARIAVTNGRSGAYEIWTMRANGSDLKRLTVDATDPSGGASDEPAWSPDGTKIVFSQYRYDGSTSGADLFVMNWDGTNKTRLTSAVNDDVMPSWAPDGSKIIFRSARDGNNEIYTMNPDGSAQTRVTNSASDETEPRYAADGAKIIYCSNASGLFEVYSMNADGSGSTLLSTGNAASECTPRV